MGKSPYSPELREKIAKEYLAGAASSGEIANKYNIPSDKLFVFGHRNIKNKEYSLLLKGAEMLAILLNLKCSVLNYIYPDKCL